MKLDNEFAVLQQLFAQTDLLTKLSLKSKNGITELLLIKKRNMKIKIYQEKGHYLPHIHIDYGKEKHLASYSIESGERLDGNLQKKYDNIVSSWIETNRDNILKVWQELQEGKPVDCLIAELVADA